MEYKKGPNSLVYSRRGIVKQNPDSKGRREGKKYVAPTTPPAPVDILQNRGRIDLLCDVFLSQFATPTCAATYSHS
jgi:hypothetical protein